MGTHAWTEDCTACGYDKVEVYTDTKSGAGEGHCPVCGYERRIVEFMPDGPTVRRAKALLASMTSEEVEDAIERLYEDSEEPYALAKERSPK